MSNEDNDSNQVEPRIKLDDGIKMGFEPHFPPVRFNQGHEWNVQHLYDIEEEDDVGIADLVLKEEKPQRDTDPEKATQPCVKLGQVFQTAMEEEAPLFELIA
nr:putative late blight resistance protein homolog R1B-16 [Ipomoea trifida]